MIVFKEKLTPSTISLLNKGYSHFMSLINTSEQRIEYPFNFREEFYFFTEGDYPILLQRYLGGERFSSYSNSYCFYNSQEEKFYVRTSLSRSCGSCVDKPDRLYPQGSSLFCIQKIREDSNLLSINLEALKRSMNKNLSRDLEEKGDIFFRGKKLLALNSYRNKDLDLCAGILSPLNCDFPERLNTDLFFSNLLQLL